jgi:hypothetical protein
MPDESPSTPSTPTRPASPYAIPAGVLLVALFIYHQRYLTFLDSTQKLVGTDYAYFLPHLLAGDYWFARNGPFAVPWATPAFCGGLPFYANPQSFYYSPAQWLSFVVDPLTAVRWSILLFAAAGAAGTYLLLSRSFRASMPAALFGSVVFLFNGFYSHRMLIGHFAFVSFMLVPAVTALLIGWEESRSQWLARGLGAGLLLAVMFHSGLVILFGPCAMAAIFLMLLASLRTGGGVAMVRASGVALVTAAALSVSKFVGAASFVSQFARDFYPLPGVEGVGKLVSVVSEMLFSRSDEAMSKVFRHGRIIMHLHEWEYSLSPVPLLIVGLGLAALIASYVRRERSLRVTFDQRVVILILLGLVPLALNYYSVPWNSFLKTIPVLGSMQSMSRFFCFYLPVITVAAALCLDLLPTGARQPLAFVALSAVIGFHLTEELTPEKHLPQRWYEPADVQQGWAELHDSGQVKPVQQLSLLIRNEQIDMVNGENALAHGSSSLQCYEPIFGYDLKKFPVQSLRVGRTSDVLDGDLNVKNPICFLYPEENHCRPGAHYPETRLAEAEAFLSYQAMEWKMPASQRIANAINLLALVVVPLLLGWTLRRRPSTPIV